MLVKLEFDPELLADSLGASYVKLSALKPRHLLRVLREQEGLTRTGP
jgi:hypothetical protein